MKKRKDELMAKQQQYQQDLLDEKKRFDKELEGIDLVKEDELEKKRIEMLK